MRLAGRLLLEEFGRAYPDIRGAVEAWVAEIRHASWKSPNELKSQYGSASILGGGRVVFNLRGNTYRLLARFDYVNQQCLVERIGTHAEYDSWQL